ncbi:MAG: flagellar M-ring protein FliF [Candidatus Accumulibacter sp.]|jgi:flagellar M-ring protein FliF|nr:flagellar M-ring protein FliF [Accumulibacter sp.]
MAANGTETSPETTAGNPLDRARQAFDRLTSQQKILLGTAVAALIAIVVAAGTWFGQSEYRVLFSNISERDGGAIIAALDQMNVPYRFSESGSAILIPGDRVNETRLRLATQGLPKGGNVGFELLENQKFGISQFAEQVNYQRGLEGELSKTIQSIGAVRAARVHLAIPKPTVFVREEQKPSASVLLDLYPGRSLDPTQIAGIQKLVAASVPNLSPERVELLDQSGAALSPLKSPLMLAGLDPTQLRYVKEIEAAAIKQVEDILSPYLGEGNFRVQVAADIDFSVNEQTAETYRPNAAPPDISIRSQQTSESASTMPSAQGVPGAISNQPPVPATAPLTQPPVPGAGPAPGTGAPPVPGQIDAAGVRAPIANVGQPVNTRKDSTTNYEVDRTIRHTKQSVGAIRRLTAAVVVNYRKDAKGVPRPLAETELNQIESLVRNSAGFSQERGDSVSVVNAQFTPVEKTEAAPPIWKDPEMLMIGKDVFKYLLTALIVAYIIFRIILPLVRRVVQPAPLQTVGGNIDVVDEESGGEEEEEEAHETAAADTLSQKIEQVREIARQNPKAVANIIMNWTGTNSGG